MEDESSDHQNSNVQRIGIERDYSKGTNCVWETIMPVELQNIVPEDTFNETINKLNQLFAVAEDYTCFSFLEGSLSFLTCFTLHLCYPGQYVSAQKNIEAFIKTQNKTVYQELGVEWLNPFKNGLLNIIILIYD
eukprot:TRINITY_DN14368_c0_g1_i1.p1 TRINITY_DN14368_c0_g1~~TRINITY_DN14368_c0_g1_i1.p1  ORF type:complete len:134 (-),score=24.52 TRINITY_DN14368_c0_g1_i1:151-552(-)